MTIALGLPRAQIRFLRSEAERLGTRPSVIAQSLIRREMASQKQHGTVTEMTGADTEVTSPLQPARGPPSRIQIRLAYSLK